MPAYPDSDERLGHTNHTDEQRVGDVLSEVTAR